MKTAKNLEYTINSLPEIAAVIKENELWFKKIEVEYRKETRLLIVRLKGSGSMNLSKNYTDTVTEQLRLLDDLYVRPLLEHVKTGFLISTEVNGQGRFTLSEVNLKLKVHRGNSTSYLDACGRPLRILMPFSLYILNIEFIGNRNKLDLITAEIRISSEELIEVLEDPLIAPRARKHWESIAHIVYLESQEQYRYEVNVPVIEGEIYWENKVSTLQFTMTNIKTKKVQ